MVEGGDELRGAVIVAGYAIQERASAAGLPRRAAPHPGLPRALRVRRLQGVPVDRPARPSRSATDAGARRRPRCSSARRSSAWPCSRRSSSARCSRSSSPTPSCAETPSGAPAAARRPAGRPRRASWRAASRAAPVVCAVYVILVYTARSSITACGVAGGPTRSFIPALELAARDRDPRRDLAPWLDRALGDRERDRDLHGLRRRPRRGPARPDRRGAQLRQPEHDRERRLVGSPFEALYQDALNGITADTGGVHEGRALARAVRRRAARRRVALALRRRVFRRSRPDRALGLQPQGL